MANEFKVRKSLVVNGSGSVLLDVQGSQGQLFSVTDSLSGSLFSVKDISGMPIMEVFSDDTVRLGRYAAEAIIVSGSFARMTGSLLGTASYATQALTASNANTASFVILAQTASFVQTAQTASFVQTAQTASYVLNAVSSSFAATASSADNLTVRGTLTAQTINVQTITSSIEFNTGSTRNGSLSTNTHEFTGSVGITGSLDVRGNQRVTGSLTVTEGITGSLQGTAATASFVQTAQTASYVLNAVSASHAVSASRADSATTASYVLNAVSSSFALTASYISGSGGGVGFPFSGSAVITGSFLVSSSFVDFTQATYVTGSFTGSLQGTASYASYAEYAGNSPGTTAAFTQSLAATTWSFTHNLNTRNPLLQVYDSTNSQVIPFNIVGDDPTTAIIYFDTPESGFAVASNGGGLTVNGSTARLNQTVAATTWSFNHDLGTRYPNFIIYGSNDEVVIPAGIKAIDNFNAEIYFSTASTGTAIANFSGISGSPNAASASYAETASFSNNFIVGNTLTIDQTLTDYHVVPSSAAGENNMFNRATGSYSSGFFKYTVANGSNARTGEVMVVWAGGAIQFTDNSTLDIGDTSGVVASAVIAASSIQFNLTTATSGWRLKSLATFM
jgi:hypothetical protein